MKRQILLTKETKGDRQLDSLFHYYDGTILWFRVKKDIDIALNNCYPISDIRGIAKAVNKLPADHARVFPDNCVMINLFDGNNSMLQDAEEYIADIVNRLGVAKTLCIFDHAITEGSLFFRALLRYPSSLMCDIVFIQDELNDFYTVLDSSDDGIRSDVCEDDFYSNWDIVSDNDKMILFNWYGVCEHLTGQSLVPADRELKQTLCSLSANPDIVRMAADGSIHTSAAFFDNASIDSILLASSHHEVENTWFPTMRRLFLIPPSVSLSQFSEKYQEWCKSTIEWNKRVDRYMKLADCIRCKTGIIADITPFDVKRLDERIKLGRLSHTWLSCETAMLSNNEKLLCRVLYDSLIAPENILLVDHSAARLSCAKRMGLQSFQYCSLTAKYTEKFISSFLCEDACISFIPSLTVPGVIPLQTKEI